MIPGFPSVARLCVCGQRGALLPDLRRAFGSPRPLFYRLSSISMIKPEGYQLLCVLLPPARQEFEFAQEEARQRQRRRVNKITFLRSFTNKITKINKVYNSATFSFCHLLAIGSELENEKFLEWWLTGRVRVPTQPGADLESMFPVIYGRVSTGWLSFCLNLGKLFIRIHDGRPAEWPWSQILHSSMIVARVVTSPAHTAACQTHNFSWKFIYLVFLVKRHIEPL